MFRSRPQGCELSPDHHCGDPDPDLDLGPNPVQPSGLAHRLGGVGRWQEQTIRCGRLPVSAIAGGFVRAEAGGGGQLLQTGDLQRGRQRIAIIPGAAGANGKNAEEGPGLVHERARKRRVGGSTLLRCEKGSVLRKRLNQPKITLNFCKVAKSKAVSSPGHGPRVQPRRCSNQKAARPASASNARAGSMVTG